MSEHDPIDMFNVLDPTDPHETADRDAALLAQIIATNPGEPRRRSSKTRWIAVASVAIAGLAIAAFAVLRSAPLDDPTGVVCAVTTDPDGDLVGLPPSDDPVAACSELWTDGTLGSGDPPTLAACVNEAGTAVVFPAGSEICSRLGLPELEPGFTGDQQSVVELQEQLAETFLDECFTQDEAIAETQRQLDTFGLTQWTVRVAEPFAESGLCAGPGVDIRTETVVLGGVREP